MTVGGSKRRADSGTRQTGRGGSAAHSAAASNGRLVFTFFSDYAKAHDAQRQILESAERHGFAGENFFALRIALEEALVNAIKHGNRMDPKKKVHVEAHVTAASATITVEDEGAGFERTGVPDPTCDENIHRCSGRGILLIEAYMSQVKWDHGGRRLSMTRENKA